MKYPHASLRIAGLAIGAALCLLSACGGGSSAPTTTVAAAAAAEPAPLPAAAPASAPAPAPAVPSATVPAAPASCSGWCWQLAEQSAGDGSPLLSHDFKGSIGLALNTSGQVLRSDDSGASWRMVAGAKALPWFAEPQRYSGGSIRVASGQVAFAWPQWDNTTRETTVYRSGDAGVSWQPWASAVVLAGVAPSSAPEPLLLVDEKTIVLVRWTDALAARAASRITTDGGSTWRELPFVVSRVGPTGTLTGEQFASLETTQLWRSEDLGQSSRLLWDELQRPISGALGARQALSTYGVAGDNAQLLWLRSRNGPAQLSRDGGLNWSATPNLRGMARAAADGSVQLLEAFRSDTLLPNNSYSFSLAQSADFGLSWLPLNWPAPVVEPQILTSGLVDTQTLWLELKDGTRRVSSDAGKTLHIAPAVAEIAGSTALQALAGGSLHFNREAASLDAGRTWRRLPGATGVSATLMSVAFLNSQRGQALLCDQTLLETSDGGAHWSRRAVAATLPAAQPVSDIPACAQTCEPHFPDGALQWLPDGSGWMLLRGWLWRSTDEGRNWAVAPVEGAVGERVVAFGTMAAGEVCVHTRPSQVGTSAYPIDAQAHRRLFHSRDGGKIWLNKPLLASPVAPLVDGQHNVGELGFTSDGGASWRVGRVSGVQSIPNRGYTVGMQFKRLDMLNAAEGTALVTVDRLDFPFLLVTLLLRTADGGQTWVQVASGQNDGNLPSLLDVRFADANTGWALDAGSALWATRDGGRNWQQQAQSPRGLKGLFVLDAQRAWVFGKAGALLATTTAGK